MHRYRRIVRYHEAQIRLLALGEVFLKLPYLLVPETLSRRITLGGVADVAVQHDKMGLPQSNE